MPKDQSQRVPSVVTFWIIVVYIYKKGNQSNGWIWFFCGRRGFEFSLKLNFPIGAMLCVSFFVYSRKGLHFRGMYLRWRSTFSKRLEELFGCWFCFSTIGTIRIESLKDSCLHSKTEFLIFSRYGGRQWRLTKSVGWLLTYSAFRSDTSNIDPHGDADLVGIANHSTERDFKNLAVRLPNWAVRFIVLYTLPNTILW